MVCLPESSVGSDWEERRWKKLPTRKPKMVKKEQKTVVLFRFIVSGCPSWVNECVKSTALNKCQLRGSQVKENSMCW